MAFLGMGLEKKDVPVSYVIAFVATNVSSQN